MNASRMTPKRECGEKGKKIKKRYDVKNEASEGGKEMNKLQQ